MSARIGKKQLELLQHLRYTREGPHMGVMLNIEDTFFDGYYWPAKRYLENMQGRGLITIENQHFIRITQAGIAAMEKAEERTP